MPLQPRPLNPSLDHFKHQARDLQQAHRVRDLAANQRIREFHPRLRDASEDEISAAKINLADAQVTVAREYGFPSWTRLREYALKGETGDPNRPMHERIEDPTFRRAVDLIDAGDETGLRSLLRERPELVRQRVYFDEGSYFGNPTLLQFTAENPVRRGTLPPNLLAVVLVLLDAGANPDDGALGLVATGRVVRECGLQIPMIDLLCSRGADPQLPMHGALAHGEFAAAEALLRHGAKLDLPTAAALGRTEDTKRILPSASDRERHMALALAAQHGQLEIVRLLLDAGEDPSRYNPLGTHAHSTPLHQAVCYRHFEVVRLLVERGARLDLEDTIFHSTPLGWAKYGGHSEIAEYLLAATILRSAEI